MEWGEGLTQLARQRVMVGEVDDERNDECEEPAVGHE